MGSVFYADARVNLLMLFAIKVYYELQWDERVEHVSEQDYYNY